MQEAMDVIFLIRLLVLFLATISDGICLILRLPCLDHADFTVFEIDKVLNGSTLKKFSNVTDTQCMTECLRHRLCKSYNIQLETKECEINSKTIGEEGALIQSRSGWVFKTTDYNKTEVGEVCEELRPCKPGILCKDSCAPPYYECIRCDSNHYGLHCDKLFVSSRNIARGKETDQSSTRAAGGASGRAVDGNKDVHFFTGASCTHTEEEDKPWWRVDLGKPYLVHSLNITNRGDAGSQRLSDFDVTVDNNLCRHHSGIVGSGTTILLSCSPPIVGRIVKIQLRAKEVLTLCEVEVYETLLKDPYECSKNPCQNRGTCTPTGDGYKCTCLNGYSGKNCEIDNNECSSLPCFNGGACIDGENSFSCQCVPGYTGINCETNINECASNPCSIGGICDDLLNSYRCHCYVGFTGTVCETNIDECNSNPCQNGGTCVDEINRYSCNCRPGYGGTHCQTDIDECASSPCKNGATCAEALNSYSCTCKPGFSGTNCEIDENECQSNPCKNYGYCNNLANAYSCSCAPGYAGTNCETDVNECQSSPCKNGGTCTNKVNYYVCSCWSGYFGTNCETFNPCQSNPCQQGTCQTLASSFKCNCYFGYTGNRCQTDINECASGPCKNGGTCKHFIGTYKCTCPSNFFGINCEVPNPCNSSPCKNGGTCKVYPTSSGATFSCSCRLLYYGQFCQKSKVTSWGR